MLVAFSAGGPGDTVARKLGERLAKKLGKPVIIENKVGAGGAIATSLTANAKPDGYTLLFNTNAVTTEVAIKQDLPYNVLRDLVPLTKAVNLPTVVLVNRALPVKSLRDLVDYGRSKPGQLTFGSSGIGSFTHFSAESLMSIAGLEGVHVPYGGGAPMQQALMAGDINLLVSPISTSKPLAAGGKVKALAVTSPHRSSYWPEVPTSGEAGYPAMQFSLWFGFFAPAKTPARIVATLNTAIREVLKENETSAWLAEQGFEPVGNSPDEFRKELQGETEKWTTLAKKLNIRAN